MCFVKRWESVKYTCVIDEIDEWRMCWYHGRLTVFENADKQAVVCRPENVWWFPQAAFGRDERLLFLFAYAWDDLPIVVLKPEERIFTAIRLMNGFQYAIEEVDATHIRLLAEVSAVKSNPHFPWVDGLVLDLEQQPWFPLEKLNQLHELVQTLHKIT